VSIELRDRLVPFMAFRHFFTHAYGFDLDAQRLAPLVRDVRVVCACFKKEARQFVTTQATSTRAANSQSRRPRGKG